ncbi:50S ribosomal protein L6 [Puniceicoccales bacterium CK1056]|uniref:Large ribosomal subunit protein uL6 n=1 Tax=Oceanipulchritudo coccoides TaxID=2706888 RepID=A0A6B2M176_9BACT|nr:50S ribosomal protein L6 [Oceanipulchritudo coccoides]NDV62658.1 50S ribosomal protein L6 [Oceanipulchritudo coccoides]
MSRIGKLPVTIPEKVEVKIENGSTIQVKGPKGSLTKSFNPKVISIKESDGSIVVEPVSKSREARAMYGTARSLINGMVEGVTKGFEKNLTISGVGFKANVEGNKLDLALGYSHPIKHPIPEGLTVTVQDQTKVKVVGYDKQVVGEFAARVKKFFPAEPYKGKGVSIDGEYVRRKEGKKAG